MSTLQEILGKTDEEMILETMDGLKELGAVYKSHNEHNLYITIPKGVLLDNKEYIKKAKRVVELNAKRVLRIVEP